MIVVSESRYMSPGYVMKPDRFESVRPIIIANWETFDMEGEYIMPACKRLEEDAKLIKSTLMTKFRDAHIVECYNLGQELLLKTLKDEGKK